MKLLFLIHLIWTAIKTVCKSLIISIKYQVYIIKMNLNDRISPYVLQCALYAVRCHAKVNQVYDGKPYYVHLEKVYEYGIKYQYLLPENHREKGLGGCWTHDTIEDTGQTFNDVNKNCDRHIAEITYALTNEKGRNRKERANAKYYQGIRSTDCAVFAKICDRLANVSYGKKNKGSMLDAYRKEYDNFYSELYKEEYEAMFKDLRNMLYN